MSGPNSESGTAVLLGGTSLSGGVGTVPGSLVGLLCIGVLGNGLNLFDVPAYYQRIAQGLLLLSLGVLERLAHREAESMGPYVRIRVARRFRLRARLDAGDAGLSR